MILAGDQTVSILQGGVEATACMVNDHIRWCPEINVDDIVDPGTTSSFNSVLSVVHSRILKSDLVPYSSSQHAYAPCHFRFHSGRPSGATWWKSWSATHINGLAADTDKYKIKIGSGTQFRYMHSSGPIGAKVEVYKNHTTVGTEFRRLTTVSNKGHYVFHVNSDVKTAVYGDLVIRDGSYESNVLISRYWVDTSKVEVVDLDLTTPSRLDSGAELVMSSKQNAVPRRIPMSNSVAPITYGYPNKTVGFLPPLGSPIQGVKSHISTDEMRVVNLGSTPLHRAMYNTLSEAHSTQTDSNRYAKIEKSNGDNWYRFAKNGNNPNLPFLDDGYMAFDHNIQTVPRQGAIIRVDVLPFEEDAPIYFGFPFVHADYPTDRWRPRNLGFSVDKKVVRACIGSEGIFWAIDYGGTGVKTITSQTTIVATLHNGEFLMRFYNTNGELVSHHKYTVPMTRLATNPAPQFVVGGGFDGRSNTLSKRSTPFCNVVIGEY